MGELEDRLYAFFRYTVFLWLFPYIVWYFARRLWLWVYAWVTRPVPEVPSSERPAVGEPPSTNATGGVPLRIFEENPKGTPGGVPLGHPAESRSDSLGTPALRIFEENPKGTPGLPAGTDEEE